MPSSPPSNHVIVTAMIECNGHFVFPSCAEVRRPIGSFPRTATPCCRGWGASETPRHWRWCDVNVRTSLGMLLGFSTHTRLLASNNTHTHTHLSVVSAWLPLCTGVRIGGDILRQTHTGRTVTSGITRGLASITHRPKVPSIEIPEPSREVSCDVTHIACVRNKHALPSPLATPQPEPLLQVFACTRSPSPSSRHSSPHYPHHPPGEALYPRGEHIHLVPPGWA